MASYELVAWLYGVPVALIREQRTGATTLQYQDEAFERWRLGEAVLSIALPLTPERYPLSRVAPFLEGMLPEGEARTTLESNFRIRRGDTFGFLTALGRDCAGAVMFQRSDDAPPSATGTNAHLAPLTHQQVVAEIEALGTRPLGADAEVRLSLAGQQDKLLLTRTADGGWARPVGATPSTHILKPERTDLPGLVANEAFCLRVARELGLTTITVEELDARGRPVLVVSRYDRVIDDRGRIARIHQEDLCQALGVLAGNDAKYESAGGPSLRDAARVLDTWAGRETDLERLLCATTLNVVVGNADAHGKNISLLHDPTTGTSLAPLYDVASTIHYPVVDTPQGTRTVSTALAMSVNDQTDIDAVTVDDLVEEARGWPYDARRARDAIIALLERMPSAVESAGAAGSTVAEDLVERTRQRATALLEGKAAGALGRS